nr:DUF3021 domain-containing protein [Maliibacterium massiliense]
MKKRVFLRALLGAPLGVFICMTIALILSLCRGELVVVAIPASQMDPVAAFALQYGLSMLLGAVFAGASCIFEVERWSLLKQTCLHFCIVTPVMFLISVLCQWMPVELDYILAYIGIFLVTYAICWYCQYRFWSRKVKDVNDMLHSS